MSQVFLCDGCGTTSDEEMATLGRTLKRDYCAACKPRAEKFMLEVDGARKQIAAAFKMGLAELAEKYGAGGFKLPDTLIQEAAPAMVENG